MRPILFLAMLVAAATGAAVHYGRTQRNEAVAEESTPIVSAIKGGDLAEVRRLVAENKNVVHDPIAAEMPEQPLHYAAWQGKPEIASFLIEQGAGLDARGDGGQTPLHYAARYGSPDVAAILLDRGANPDVEDGAGFTPLFTASRGREPECTKMAELLVRRGAKVCLNDWVCMGRLKEICEVLNNDSDACKKARFPGYLIEDMVTLIQCRVWEKAGPGDGAAMAGVDEVMAETLPLMNKMLDQGADPNGGFGTALFYAVQLPTADVARLLLERGASVTTKRELNLLAIARNESTKALLMKHGAR